MTKQEEKEKIITNLMAKYDLLTIELWVKSRIRLAMLAAYRAGIRKAKKDAAKNEAQYTSRPGIQM